MAKKSMIVKCKLHTQIQQMQDLWTSAWIYAQVRHVQSLLPRTGKRRPDPWRDQVKLVGVEKWQ